MNYIYIKNLLLDNIEKNIILLNIIKSLLDTLKTIYSDDIEDTIILLTNNNIEILNNKIKKNIDLLPITINHKNIDDLITFIDIYSIIYSYKIEIDIQLSDIINELNRDFSLYNFNFTTKNILDKNSNIINKEYDFYFIKNQQIVNDLNSYFSLNITPFLNEIKLYNYMSNILTKNYNIINLYIIVLNLGIEYTFNKNDNLYKNIIIVNEKNIDLFLDIKYQSYNIKRNLIFKNNLQDFGLIPKFLYDKKNKILSLTDIIYNITKIKPQQLDNLKFDEIYKKLNIIMKTYSNNNKKNTSIFIIHINNNTEYNIDLLLKNINIRKTQGITTDIIKLFNTIQPLDKNKKIIKNNINLINYKHNDTEQSIILRTTDLVDYQLLYHNNSYIIPINIIENILRNTPSKRIMKYNQYLENNILKYKTIEYEQQFALDTYLDFSTIDNNSEKIYTELSNFIYKSIIHKIKKNKLSDLELINIINNSENIIDNFNNILNAFYVNIIKTIKNIDKKISNNIYISYLSICDNLSIKFKKNLTDKYIYYNTNSTISNTEKLNTIIKESIDSIINKESDLYLYIIDKYNILNSYKKY